MIPPFCLPNHSIVSMTATTYAIAFYPLIVLILLHVSIELFSRDFRIIVWLWSHCTFSWVLSPTATKMHGIDDVFDCHSLAAIFLSVCLVISVEYAVLYFKYNTHPYNSRNSLFNHLHPLTLFSLLLWLISYRDIHLSAGKQLLFQHFSVALCLISIIFPLILITFYNLRNCKLSYQ